jgi:KDO2-lipid IV(A) lauroyltransferase
VARLGRIGGELAYWCDGRHRRVAVRNLTRCLGGQRTAREVRALARENFRRLGENYASAVKTAFLTSAELRPHVEFKDTEKILPVAPGEPFRSRVFAVGHFGNFELYARFHQFEPGFRSITTYRGLRQPALNRLLQSIRARSGCEYFERRTEASALKAAMRGPGAVFLGLLADQHAGDRGLRLPFLGQECSCSAAPALFALRYRCPLHTAICYRTAPAQWRIEVGDEIPTHTHGRPRPIEEITLDVNRAFEAAVLRDPANWFWVHERWKPAKRAKRSPASVAGWPNVMAAEQSALDK